jgi:hypothetical protein
MLSGAQQTLTLAPGCAGVDPLPVVAPPAALHFGSFVVSERTNWRCPHCNHHVTIGDADQSNQRHTLEIENVLGRVCLFSLFRVCRNEDCRQPTLLTSLWPTERNFTGGQGWSEDITEDDPNDAWRLIPFGAAKPFPDYIPEGLRNDYAEACSIAQLSPKAAATLCRRCLQGMIRDFWQVDTKSNRLWDEMKAIKDKVDPDTWGAIVALKDLGNIGAHMEMDVDTIVDVEPREAGLLIELIESLFEDWYIQREQRRKRNADLMAAAAGKKPSVEAVAK